MTVCKLLLKVIVQEINCKMIRYNLLMVKQRRFTFQELLKLLQITSNDVGRELEAEVTSSSEFESIYLLLMNFFGRENL